jgi:hypothetical protein
VVRLIESLRRVLGDRSSTITPFLVGAIIVFAVFWWLSAIPWALTYLFVGKLVLADFVVEYLVFGLFVVMIPLFSVFVSTKLMKESKRGAYLLSLGITFLIAAVLISSFSVVFMPQLSAAGKKMSTFVAQNRSLEFHDYVANLTAFLNNNIDAAWDKPEMSLAIDKVLCRTLLDPYIMNASGVNLADLILFQGWGSCGEAAIVIDRLLHMAGYETRLGFFKGIDHEWAEAKYNGTWLIIDPWYIGNFVEAQNLRNAKSAFQNASGVEVRYQNGTTTDASHEHGY